MASKETKKNIFEHPYPVVYVIGGAGFIGSYVIEKLIKEDINILSIDDFIAGKEENIKKFKEKKTFKNIELDINTEELENLPSPDYILHIGGIEEYIEGKDVTTNTMLVNAIGTYKTLEIAKKNKSKYLLVSSLDIYGGVLSSTDMQNYFGISDRDERRYSHHEAKRYAEALVTEYYKKFEIDARIVRITETYGPRMNIYGGSEIANLLRDAIESDTLNIQGDGLKIINLTYVADIADGIVKAMKSVESKGKIFNLASEQEVNILNLAYIIQKNSTKPLKIQFSPEYKEIKIPRRKIELQQTKKLLNWQAKTSLDQGITETLEYLFLNENNKEKKGRTTQNNLNPQEIPYIPPATKRTLNDIEAIKDKNEQKKENEKSKKQNKKDKINIINATILALSVFIVLQLFIFPITSLYYSTRIAIAKANQLKNPLEEKKDQKEDIKKTQKYIAFANAQFDTIEWFFGMTQQRSKIEGTRATVSLIEKYIRAINEIENSKFESDIVQKKILNGKMNDTSKEIHTKSMNKAIAYFENTLLENQSATENILNDAQKKEIKSIIDKTNELLKKSRTLSAIQQNAITYFAPSQEKHIALVFIDSAYINPIGGKIYGYILLKTNKNGIKDIHFIPYENENSYSALTQDIKKNVENLNFGTIEAVVLINDTARNNIIKALKQVSNTKYAMLLTYENIKVKEDEYDSKKDFKISAWESIWDELKKQTTYSEVNKQIINEIKNENIQVLTIQENRNIKIPECLEENGLKVLFTDVVNNHENTYCIAPKIHPEEEKVNISSKIAVKANIKSDLQEIKTTIEVDNNEKKDNNIKVILTIPGRPKLTNLLSPYPVSFDKVEQIIEGTTTKWGYTLQAKAKRKSTVTFEWSANLSDGNIEENGIFIEKQFGLEQINISAEIKKENNKTIKKEVKNKDLIIPNENRNNR